MPATELDRWAAFYAVNPFGSFREDLRFARLNETVVRMHADPKKIRTLSVWDFMPFDKKPEPSPVQLVTQLSGIFGRPGEIELAPHTEDELVLHGWIPLSTN